jgi:hypothetical protein
MGEDQAISLSHLETISVSGLPDDAVDAFAFKIAGIVGALASNEVAPPLDLRRMRRMVFAADYSAALEELAGDSGRPVGPTQEDYAVGVAKVLLLPLDQGDFEIVPVFDIDKFAILGSDYESLDGQQKDYFTRMLHVLHHELCHVHDDNKKVDAMPGAMLSKVWDGPEIFVGPLTEASWSEYFANRVSSLTANRSSIDETVQMFKDAVERTKPVINDHIIAYRTNWDLDGLVALFKRHGDFLVKSAAYMLGYLDGIGQTLEELSAEAHQALIESDFLPFWNRMHVELKAMFNRHPEGWDNSLDIYAGLLQVMQDFYDDMGLVLRRQPDGGLYVDIPFRANNSTPEMMRWASGRR